jgi:hypothetical protein
MLDGMRRSIGRSRSRLNALIATHRALAWAAPASLAAGLLAALLRALGFSLGAYALLACLTAAAAAAGALRSRKAFLDEAGAARWLDESLGECGLISAALDGLERGGEGRFDPAIAEAAEALLPRAARLRGPMGPLLRRAAIAAAALALGAYMVFLSAPLESSTAARRERGARAGTGAGQERRTAAKAVLEEGGPAAADFASSLFPDDRRMATLVERALREGRLDDLRELLKAAGLELDSKIARSIDELERKKLTKEKERLGEAAAELSMAAGDEASRGEAEGGRGAGGRGEAGPGAQGGLFAEGSGGAGDSRPGSEADAEQAEGGAAARGGKGYGAGSGSEGEWGRVETAASHERLELGAEEKGSFFELVLPGGSAAAPVSKLAPASRRAAEAAMTRESLPLEYEDFVRSYFLALSKGEKR